MHWLLHLIYKWQKRKMCRCDSPTYLVIDKKLACKNCYKPLHKLDVEIR